MQHNATAQALIARQDPPRRPFVLSRSFFAGSQRYGAIWTGDNMGTWEHLAVATPMILANSIAGMTFNGGKGHRALTLSLCMLRYALQPTSAVSSEIPTRKYWCGGIKVGPSILSSEHMRTLTPRDENHISLKSLLEATFETIFACGTLFYLPGIPPFSMRV